MPATTEQFLYPEHTLSLSFLDGRSWFVGDPGSARSGLARVPAVFVDNPTTHPIRIVSRGRTRMVGVNLYVWGAIRLFGRLPANDGVLGSIIPETLSMRIAGALARGELDEALDILEQFIAGRAGAVDLAPNTAIRVATSLRDTAGQGSIGALAEMTGVSIRQLERQFHQHVGMSPKTLARLIRFERARRDIEKRPEANLTRLAYELGFADQAHFSREFRTLARISPRAFQASVRRRRGFVPVSHLFK